MGGVKLECAVTVLDRAGEVTGAEPCLSAVGMREAEGLAESGARAVAGGEAEGDEVGVEVDILVPVFAK